MPCTIIPTATPSPLVSEKIVSDIQLDISNNCALWLDVVYPIAFIGEELYNIPTKGNLESTRLRKFPRIYKNDGKTDYIDVTPNDNLKGYCFFEIRDDYNFDRIEDEVTITLSIVFWANMRKIDDRGYDYKTALIGDAVKCLHGGTYKNRIENIVITENFEDVYDRYEFQGTSNRSRNEQTELQQFMYPYTSFKITFNLTIDYNIDCLPSFEVQVGPSDC